jgi:hypothetical protein
MPREDGEEQLLDIGQMELSFQRVACLFDAALGRPLRAPDSDAWTEQDTLAYRAALTAAVNHFETNEAGTTVNDVAAAANRAWQEVVKPGQPVTAFPSIAAPIREKWRYLARHVANVMAFDGSEDGAVQGHEETITAIFTRKLEEIGHIKK